jgi:basic membrane protein A and related proteins
MEEHGPVTDRRRLLPLTLLNVALLAVLVVMVVTSPKAARTTAEPSPAQQSASPRPDASVVDLTPRIALVHDVDGRSGAALSRLALEGIKRAARGFDAEVKEVAGAPDDTDADRELRLRELAEARYDPIFVIGSTYASAVARVAPDYPHTWFGTVDDGTVDAANVIGILFHEEQGSFLVGAAAALTSKTGEVGFIGAVQEPLFQEYEAGFTAGALAANPEIKVRVAYLARPPGTPGPADPAEARNVASRMYDAGADVIFAAAGESATGVMQAAHERGLWAIGADTDQYLASDPSVRGAILTSMLKRADMATYTITMEVANRVPKDGNNVLGLDRDGVGYATSGGFVDAIKGQLDAFADRIAAGEILVPTKP